MSPHDGISFFLKRREGGEFANWRIYHLSYCVWNHVVMELILVPEDILSNSQNWKAHVALCKFQ